MESMANVYVEIAEQPMGKCLRFRYISEGRTAGSIQGERSTPEHRTFPSIRVHNYSGQAYAIVSCVTTDKPPRPHPHHLVGTNCQKGVCQVAITVSNDPIPFSNIGIQCCTRKDISKNLEERRVMKVDPFNTGYQANVDNIDLTTICLCFQVLININGQLLSLQPVVSNPIVDKKVCSELSIYRLSRISGSVRGGDEVFLLCTKVKKEDIKVMFSHSLENGDLWEKEGSFSSTDVHKQYVIVFKTPPYHDIDIKKPVEVSLYLLRPSDSAVGEAKTFTYYPENPDPFGIKAKRKRLAQSNPPCFISEIKPPPFPGLASVIGGSQAVSISQFGGPSGLNDGFSQWTHPHLSISANTQGMPAIKPELPFYQTSQTGIDGLGPGSTRFIRNSNTMSAIPTTVADAVGGIARLLPSSTYSSPFTKDFNFGLQSTPFRPSSSASALEKLVTHAGSEMTKPGSFVNAEDHQITDLFYSRQPSNIPLPSRPSQPSALSRSGVESLFSGLEDSTMLTEFFGNDWLRANLPSEEQTFPTDALPDLSEMTDDEDLKKLMSELDFPM